MNHSQRIGNVQLEGVFTILPAVCAGRSSDFACLSTCRSLQAASALRPTCETRVLYPKLLSLLQVTAESDSEDEEAQLEAAEHRAAYNLEAPSTAPATTGGGSSTGGSTQTGSGLGTAAGGGNAMPRAADDGAAQPPAEVCKPQLGLVIALAPHRPYSAAQLVGRVCALHCIDMCMQ